MPGVWGSASGFDDQCSDSVSATVAGISDSILFMKFGDGKKKRWK